MLEILTILGSLASISSLALQTGIAQRADGSIDINDTIGRLDLTTEQQEALSVDGSYEIVSLLIIDHDLLDDLKIAIKICIQKYRDGMRKASDRARKDVVDKAAERCVCDALNRIKRRNDGKLPPGDFQRWWKSYRCVDDYDY